MYSKIKQFLDAAPRALTSANEIYNFARNRFKQIMGVFPDGLDDVFLKRGAAEMQDVRQKVVKFPEGGKDKTDFFSTRPDPRLKQPEGAKMDVQRAHENLSGGSNYAKGDTKYNADVLADEIARQRKSICFMAKKCFCSSDSAILTRGGAVLPRGGAVLPRGSLDRIMVQ